MKFGDMKFGDKYNWEGQPERLVYLGRKGLWYQFARVETPHRVWCEVRWEDLHMMEPTPPQPIKENP